MGSATTYSYRGLAQEIRSGPREIDDLAASLDRLGAKRVMVVCGRNVLNKSDVVSRVEDALGARLVARFEGVIPHVPVDAVEAARDAALEAEPDTLVSIGGGSAVQLAKGTALLYSTDRPLTDYRVRFEPPDRVVRPSIPLPEIKVRVVAVTTTMSGAEFGAGGGGFRSRSGTEKINVAGSGTTTPKVVVIDGAALATTPEHILKATTVGQLRSALESALSPNHSPMGDALAFHSLTVFRRALEGGWKDDPASLLRIKAASCLAGHAGVVVGSPALNSAIAHQIGAVHHVSHGEANAIMLPHTIRFNAPATADRLRLVAGAFGLADHGDPDRLAASVAAHVRSWCADLMLPLRLRDVGVPKDGLEQLAEATMSDPALMTNPRRVDDVDVVTALLEAAW